MEQEKRLGRQTPTTSFVLPYTYTHGSDAVNLYEETGRTAQDWQKLLLYDILAYNDEGLYVHTKFGYAIPRRNGKGEVIAALELYALHNGIKVLHTAHKADTSSDASFRLAEMLDELGYKEVARVVKGTPYKKAYSHTKQHGLERITLLDTGGYVDFRTRTSSGGLGRGYDLLIIDEAQEYTDDQESTLKYTVSDAENPQIILCGTPPTAVSKGNVFPKLRKSVLSGNGVDSGWAEWSVESMHDVNDIDAWYETNPSMGLILTERKVRAEIGTDDIDFNIQRLGLWLQYDLKSEISPNEWGSLRCEALPKLKGKMAIGVKYAHDGGNVALSVAVKTDDGRILIECIDCQSARNGNGWIVDFLRQAEYSKVVCDGSKQAMLESDMKQMHLGKPVLPKVKEVIEANAMFEEAVFQKTICHMGQPSMVNVATHTEKRAIGSNGGFGYRCNKVGCESAILESAILAFWACATLKEAKKQKPIY